MKDLSERQYFKAWLLFFLIATVGGGIIGLIFGSFLAAFLGAGGMPSSQMNLILQVAGFVIAIPISYLAFRFVVGKYLLPKIEVDDEKSVEGGRGQSLLSTQPTTSADGVIAQGCEDSSEK